MSILHKRVTWTKEEDDTLLRIVNQNPLFKWKKVHQIINSVMPLFNKTTKQCRERWYGILNPSIQKNKWSEHELDILFESLLKNGNKWSLIREKLKGRTDHSIKNVYYCRVRKMIRRICKVQIEEDMYENNKEFERCLFVLQNIRDNYIIPLKTSKEISGDQYIVNFIERNHISEEEFYKYTSKLMKNAPLSMKIIATKKYSHLFKFIEKEGSSCAMENDTDIDTLHLKDPISIYEKMTFTFEPYLGLYFSS